MDSTVKYLVFIFLSLLINIANACDVELANYLDQAKSIAKKLPQANEELEKSRKYDDQYWIRDPALRKIGGYRYLLHDLSVGYANINCWKKALSTADLIDNLGVKDSAWAQIAIRYAKNDYFDESMKLIKAIKYPRGGEISRKYVSKELVRAGKNEEAKKVLRGAGLFGNHYESYFYQNAMNLARSGKHDEAVDYVYQLKGMKHHVRNAFGDMLILFQKRGDLANAEKILAYYEKGKSNDLPVHQLSLYYLNEGNIKKSYEYISILRDIQRQALLLLDLAITGKSEKFYSRALEVIEKRFRQDPKNNWTIVVHTAYKVYLYKGQKESNAFIYKYIDKNDHKAEIGHSVIIKELFSKGKPKEVIEYLHNVDGKMSKREYINTIAKIRTKELTGVPSISIVNNNPFTYRFVIIELLKNGYSEREIVSAIHENYKFENSTFQKSKLLNITAMVASNRLGPKNASTLYENSTDDLLYAYWLIGISQKNESHEINSALKYELSI